MAVDMSKRYKQANKEALVTLAVYLFFFLWWTVFAFALGSGDPDEYSYVLGLPAWFFYSCVLGYPVISLVLWAALRLFFKEVPLDPDKGGE